MGLVLRMLIERFSRGRLFLDIVIGWKMVRGVQLITEKNNVEIQMGGFYRQVNVYEILQSDGWRQ